MKLLSNSCALVLVLLVAPSFAWAQNNSVTSQLTAQRVEVVQGKTVFKPARDVKPGDIVRYTSTYRNGGAKEVGQLLATLPIPTGTTFIVNSAEPANAQASTDGSTFSSIPLLRNVKQPDGSERKQPVPLSEYRAVRWKLGTLPAKTSRDVSLRVRIAPPVAASASQP